MMFAVFQLLYELLCSLVPFSLAVVFFAGVRGRAGRPFPRGRYILLALFALYIVAVFHVTGTGTVYDGIDALRHLRGRVNLIPFSRQIDPVGYFLNVVMFLPFGFLLPLLWGRRGTLPGAALRSLSFSALIEVSQLLSFRGTDVDDLIMNTLGGVLGFLLYKIWAKTVGDKGTYSGDEIELPVYILALFLGRCFLFNLVGFIDIFYK